MKVDIYNTEKKYDIIYADPPWAYHDTLGGNAKMGAMPYPTMTNEEICAMPIGNKIAKKDSILFMWATMPKLQEALDVIKAWGFKYKTCAFCWVKQNPKSGGIYAGLGRWVGSLGTRQRRIVFACDKRTSTQNIQIGQSNRYGSTWQTFSKALRGTGQNNSTYGRRYGPNRTVRERLCGRLGLLGE